MALMPNESPSQFAVSLPAGLPVAAAGMARGSPGSDVWCLAYWLQARAEDSEHTCRAYRREAGRWLAFLAALRKEVPPSDNLLRQARYEDAARYVAWIQPPQGAPDLPKLPEPPKLPDLPEWAATMWGVSRLRPKRTKTVLRNAVVILHGMYEELAGAMVGEPPQPAVVVNPFKPFRRKGKKKQKGKGALPGQAPAPDAPGVAKALSDRAWSLLWHVTCDAHGDPANPRTGRVAARRRLALAMLRATWERRSAAAEIVWGDLQRSRDGTWTLQRTRKGDGPVFEAVPESLMQEIALFRSAIDLPTLPGDDEAGRSMYWIGGRVGAQGPISDDTFYRDIVELFKLAVKNVGQLELDATKAADLVKEFTKAGRGPHSIRHTMATQFMAAGGEARRAQAILGHSSIAVTTRVYDTKTNSELADALQEQWERSGTRRGDDSVMN